MIGKKKISSRIRLQLRCTGNENGTCTYTHVSNILFGTACLLNAITLIFLIILIIFIIRMIGCPEDRRL